MSDEILMPVSDVNRLDEVCAELGIQESDTTPAEAVRELKADLADTRLINRELENNLVAANLRAGNAELAQADLRSKLAAAEAREAVKTAALENAGAQFRFYEREHMAKGSISGDAKARTNAEYAELCENAARADTSDLARRLLDVVEAAKKSARIAFDSSKSDEEVEQAAAELIAALSRLTAPLKEDKNDG